VAGMGDLRNVNIHNILARKNNVLAALVSTRGSIVRPGLKKLEPFVAFCLYGNVSKLPCESGGGVAAKVRTDS